MSRVRECVCPAAVFRCLHVVADVIQAWRDEGGTYVVQGPDGGGPFGYPTWTFTRADFEGEWALRVAGRAPLRAVYRRAETTWVDCAARIT